MWTKYFEVSFLVAVVKYVTKMTYRRKPYYFGSQFECTVHLGREGVVVGTWGCWPHSSPFRKQTGEMLVLSSFLLFIQSVPPSPWKGGLSHNLDTPSDMPRGLLLRGKIIMFMNLLKIVKMQTFFKLIYRFITIIIINSKKPLWNNGTPILKFIRKTKSPGNSKDVLEE